MMPADIAVITKQVVEHLGESDATAAYGTLVANPKFKGGDITDQILSSDAKFRRAICENPGHPHRKDFLTLPSSPLAGDISSGDQLPARTGPIEAIIFTITGGRYAGARTVVPWPVTKMDELELENRNVGGLKEIRPHAILDGDTLWHNGAAKPGGASTVVVSVTGCSAYSRTAACQSPADYTADIADDVVGTLLGKDHETGLEAMKRAEAALAGIASPGRAAAA